MLLAPGADMMGMNMYGAMPNMMPGQKMQQIPVMTNPVQQEQPLSTPAPQVQPKNEVEISKEDDHKDPEPNQTEEHKIEPQEEANAVSPNVPENTTPKEVVVENIEAESQDEQQVEPQPEPEPQPETKPKDLWNDDEDEDEDDENEDSSEEDHEDEEEKEKKENTPEPQETPEVPEAKDIQVKDKEFYDSAPYHKRGGRGYSRGYPPRGPRGAYRGGRGYNKPYDPNYRGGRGGRGGRGPRGSYESGRGRGTFRGGRGKDYYQIHQSDYHYEDYNNPQEKKTEQDMDADGFMPVKEKVYKKKKRGGNFKPKRGQKDTK